MEDKIESMKNLSKKLTGKKIRDEMRKRKMTVRDLQDALELDSPQSIYKWLASSISLFRMRTNICLSIWFTVSFLPVRGNLLYSNALDLQRSVLGQLAHLHRAACGVGLCKVLAVHLVHLCKIVDVCQKHRGLDHIGQRHLLLCQNGLDVLEGLCSQRGCRPARLLGSHHLPLPEQTEVTFLNSASPEGLQPSGLAFIFSSLLFQPACGPSARP